MMIIIIIAIILIFIIMINGDSIYRIGKNILHTSFQYFVRLRY